MTRSQGSIGIDDRRIAAFVAVLLLVLGGCQGKPPVPDEQSRQAELHKIALDPKAYENDRVRAIRKIKDQEVLAKVVSSGASAWVQQVAVKGLHDQDKLGQIALRGWSLGLRTSAIKRLHDGRILFQIVEQRKDYDTQRAAVKRIEDQATLAKVALGDFHFEHHSIAVAKLTDQAVLSEVIRSNQHGRIRLEAIRKSTDSELLKHIARNDEKRWKLKERLAAIARIENEDPFLVRLANNPNLADEFAQRGIVGLAVSRVRSAEALADIEIAKSSKRFLTPWPVDLLSLCQLIQHPVTQHYHPGLQLDLTWNETKKPYGSKARGKFKLRGEKIAFSIAADQFKAIHNRWFTRFPPSTAAFRYIGAKSSLDAVVAKLLDQIPFTATEIATLKQISPRLKSAIEKARNSAR